MKRVATTLALSLAACGPPPAQVAGLYTGFHNLFVTGGTGEMGSEVISVSQNGAEIRFTMALCEVKAFADGATSFRVADFHCNKFLGAQSWELRGTEGRIDSNANSLMVSIAGNAKNGQVESPFTWSFNGSHN